MLLGANPEFVAAKAEMAVEFVCVSAVSQFTLFSININRFHPFYLLSRVVPPPMIADASTSTPLVHTATGWLISVGLSCGLFMY